VVFQNGLEISQCQGFHQATKINSLTFQAGFKKFQMRLAFSGRLHFPYTNPCHHILLQVLLLLDIFSTYNCLEWSQVVCYVISHLCATNGHFVSNTAIRKHHLQNILHIRAGIYRTGQKIQETQDMLGALLLFARGRQWYARQATH